MNRMTLEILEKAAIVAQLREMEALDHAISISPPHVFSMCFNQNMVKLISFSTKPYFRYVNTIGKRLAAILIALFILTSTTAFCVESIHEPIINFIVNTYEKFSSIVFDKKDLAEPLPKTIEQVYELTFTPDGYAVTDTETSSTDRLTVYSNRSGDEILFEQYIVEATRIGLDTENGTWEKLEVNSNEALFLSNKGNSVLVWTQDGYGYQISGRIDKDTLFKMAKSMAPKK